MDWSLRACSSHGHFTYAPDEDDLRARLTVDTAAGRAWRCLRCGTFVVGDPHGSGPADHAPEVPRGAMLRDRVIMRLLACERAIRGLFLLFAAFVVFKFRTSQGAFRAKFDAEMPLLRPIADQLGWNIDDSKFVGYIEKSFTLSTSTLTIVAALILAYAVSQFIEATGLWLMKRWGEYFAVVVTSLFIPLEVYEIVEKVTILRICLLIVNVAAVVWLIWSKHLFGVRGGAKAYEALHHSESLLTVERAALSRTA
ncbi:DUF2127 domain-containing protein [Gordonia sp. TBRC 11910]|uniref:DUF2127 domain-containing protein n=1 Tax=Gordonia asplenii TaxID=2725283 RepID=A0A848KTC5_9ACTN|nr:DUF2127 domain-containing protein [Gordonia asplenii]NMO00135.1 DUF2127 domain-containing protein [Gordonia asplenii]